MHINCFWKDLIVVFQEVYITNTHSTRCPMLAKYLFYVTMTTNTSLGQTSQCLDSVPWRDAPACVHRVIGYIVCLVSILKMIAMRTTLALTR